MTPFEKVIQRVAETHPESEIMAVAVARCEKLAEIADELIWIPVGERFELAGKPIHVAIIKDGSNKCGLTLDEIYELTMGEKPSWRERKRHE